MIDVLPCLRRDSNMIDCEMIKVITLTNIRYPNTIDLYFLYTLVYTFSSKLILQTLRGGDRAPGYQS